MFNFLKYRLIYFLISFLVISAGLFSIVKWGYRYSIDFVGGTYLEYRIGDKTYNLREKTLNQKEQDKLISTLEKKMKAKVTVLRLETVGATLGKETINKTVIASLLAVAGILIYMSLAFKGFKYAMAAILAMIHDFLVVIGSYSLLSRFFGAEVDTMFVTAVLTTMSFSVHDTIVIFDKIREYLQTEGKEDIEHFAKRQITWFKRDPRIHWVKNYREAETKKRSFGFRAGTVREFLFIFKKLLHPI